MRDFDEDKLFEICLKKRKKEINSTWNEINERNANNAFADGEQLRIWTKNKVRSLKKLTNKSDELAEGFTSKFSESIDINKDGSQTSNKLVKMSFEDSKNPKFLLKAHGYSIDEWELISARSNIWNSYSKKDGIMQLYSSKINIRPRRESNDVLKIIEAINNIKPYHIEYEPLQIIDNYLLEIPLFDQHFGISDYEYYKQTQSRIMDKINSKGWKEILFIIGQDMIHNNDMKGHTANGTQIEKIDMEKAWTDCCKFYEPLIFQAIKQSSGNVKIIYSKGNHDETISWGFVKYLKGKFTNINFDDTFKERKIHTFGKIFIGITHGDRKNVKDLVNIFIKEFSLEWANANVRELHKGHTHLEDGKDVYGTMMRTLSTRNKTDDWHDQEGYIMAHKRFMLFEYSEEELENICYV